MKENLVETYYIYFERAKKQITFLHPGIDLSFMYMFKVVHDGKLEDVSTIPQLASSYVPDIQVEPKGDKPYWDATMVMLPFGMLLKRTWLLMRVNE